MIFSRRKNAPEGAAKPAVKMHVVSVRLTDEQYQTVVENCRLSGRKLSDYWRRALLNAKVTALATPEDMAILRQLGGMANNLNQLAKKANEAGFTLVKWALDRNKNRQAKPQFPSPKPMPTPIEKAVQTGVGVAENIGNAVGGLLQVSPGYDPEEEAFIRQMKRRKKKKGRSL